MYVYIGAVTWTLVAALYAADIVFQTEVPLSMSGTLIGFSFGSGVFVTLAVIKILKK